MILALESASSDLSVALAEPDGSPIATDYWSGGQRQGSELLPGLLRVLDEAQRSLDEATAVAVGIGPGSFTGLRVGMSVAKGLAHGLRVPIVGVPSLDAWLVAEPEAGAALARAGAREGYLLLRGEDRPRLVDRERIPAVALVAPAELATAFELRDARRPRGAAAAVAGLAALRLARNASGDDLQHLEPTYLRQPRGIGQVVGG